MAVDAKYGYVTVEKEPGHPFGDSEPVFILRGRDMVASVAIEEYALACRIAGASEEHVHSIYDAKEHFEQWAALNEELMKVPD